MHTWPDKAFKGTVVIRQWRVTWNYAYSPFNIIKGKEGGLAEGDVSDVESTADSQTSTDTANFKSRLGTLSSSLGKINP